jgi:hypothetical protein
MDVREKLVEIILSTDLSLSYNRESDALNIADTLVDNNVTIAQWISVKEYTPKEKGCYLIAGNHWWDGKPVAREAFWNGDDWLSCYDKGNISRRVTHWTYLPKPPKGE